MAGKFAGIVRRGAPEDGGGEGVRVAVQADDPPLCRRRRGEIRFMLLGPAICGGRFSFFGRCVGCFFSWFSLMDRFKVRAAVAE